MDIPDCLEIGSLQPLPYLKPPTLPFVPLHLWCSPLAHKKGQFKYWNQWLPVIALTLHGLQRSSRELYAPNSLSVL